MNTANITVDPRVTANLRFVDRTDDLSKELWFQADGKKLFLSAITNERIQDKELDLLQHWLEESILNLPPYETLMRILAEEGAAASD
jgi:hypothetical protein